MTQREAFHAMMNFELPEKLCQFEPGYWRETVERWRNEGLPEGVDPWDDCGIAHYFRPPIVRDLFPPFEREVLEEDETSRVVRTEMGIVCRESKIGMRLPQFLKHPVSNREDFEKLKERLDPKSPGRYPADWAAWAAKSAEFPHILCLGSRENGFFGWLRELMWLEGLLFAYIEQPDLVASIHGLLDQIDADEPPYGIPVWLRAAEVNHHIAQIVAGRHVRDRAHGLLPASSLPERPADSGELCRSDRCP